MRKMEAGKLELNWQSLRVRKIVERALEATAGMAAQFSVDLHSHIAVDEEFSGDQDRLIQVLTNLISNAIKFSPPGAEVSVNVATVDNIIRFTVVDRGPGIAKELQPRLFGQFQQLDSSDSSKTTEDDFLTIVKDLLTHSMAQSK
jgi:signal transduction histidine kinase